MGITIVIILWDWKKTFVSLLTTVCINTELKTMLMIFTLITLINFYTKKTVISVDKKKFGYRLT